MATAECSNASNPWRRPGPTSGVPTARTLSRRPCSAWRRAEPTRGMSSWVIRRASSSQLCAADPTSRPFATSSASSSAARLSSPLIESASPSMARAASALAILGGNSRFAAMPTAAPTSVSAIRCQAADSALSEPTPSTSMPLIATSMRFARRRSTWPIAMETKISRPRLHHSSGRTAANADREGHARHHSHHPVEAAGEERDRSHLDDEHRGQRREEWLRAREQQRRHDIARDRGDRDPQDHRSGRAAVVAQPSQLAAEPSSPHVAHVSSCALGPATPRAWPPGLQL